MAGKAGRRPFGGVEARKSRSSGKVVSYRATYIGPDTDKHHRTFGDRIPAEMWLGEERKLIDAGEWTPPKMREAAFQRLTLSEWATEHVESRTLAPGTYRNYMRMIRVYLDPGLGKKYVDEVTLADVSAWHARTKTELRARARASGRKNGDGAGEAAQAYKFVSSVFRSAVARGLIDASPARVTGGGKYRRKRKPVVLTSTEVKAIAEALPERLRGLADLLSSSALRIGEARALRRRDLDLRDLKAASVMVQQNISEGGKGVGSVIGPVKTEAANRPVAIGEELATVLADHVKRFAESGRDGLVFPKPGGGLLPESTWRYAWIRARNEAGLPDVKTHDLRHTSLTMAARAGATTAELMHRAGHSEARVAMIYQHASEERDRMIAERVEAMAREDELAARREQRRLQRDEAS
ncbi:tyrosine-type recombinase/integrase [Promicromonospora sp. NPDC090134]|uniref:tyrosine-type recombinase/integrase n=1 Tax=Promicromonospora sp. NPDC090134 TaxID=3364408 RepID=UPI00380EA07C